MKFIIASVLALAAAFITQEVHLDLCFMCWTQWECLDSTTGICYCGNHAGIYPCTMDPQFKMRCGWASYYGRNETETEEKEEVLATMYYARGSGKACWESPHPSSNNVACELLDSSIGADTVFEMVECSELPPGLQAKHSECN